jgi:hypothetical protein
LAAFLSTSKTVQWNAFLRKDRLEKGAVIEVIRADHESVGHPLKAASQRERFTKISHVQEGTVPSENPVGILEPLGTRGR